MRLTLAEMMAGERRPVGEVLLEALHNTEVIMREIAVKIEDGDVEADTISRLLEYSTRAGKLAKVTIDAGVAVKLLDMKQRNQAVEARAVTEALVAGLAALGLSPQDQMVAMMAAHKKLLSLGEPEAPARASGSHADEILALPGVSTPANADDVSAHPVPPSIKRARKQTRDDFDA
jgi:hypothetical protein